MSRETKGATEPRPVALCEECGEEVPRLREDFLREEGRRIICVNCAQKAEDQVKLEASRGRPYLRRRPPRPIERLRSA